MKQPVRADFNDKELFLKTFRENGIDVDDASVYIERSGNLTNIPNVADRKKYVILKYLQTGDYSAVRMYDDDIKNLRTFMELGNEINAGKYGVFKAVQAKYPKVKRIYFFPLKVNESGKATRIFESVLMERLFPEIDNITYDNILSATGNSMYDNKANACTKWLGNLIAKGKVKPEELFPSGYTNMLRDYFDLYKKYNKAGLIKNISTFNSWEEFQKEIIKIKNSGYKSNSEKETEAKNGAKVLLNEKSIKILEINSWESAKKYGKGTKWCTSSEVNDAYFNHYGKGTSNHLLYVFAGDRKYGVVTNVYLKEPVELNIEIFDEKDELLYSPTKKSLGNIIGEQLFDKKWLEKGIIAKDFPKDLFFVIYKVILKNYAPNIYKKYIENKK